MKQILLVLSTIALSCFIGHTQEVDVNNSVIKWTGKKVIGEHYGNIQLKDAKLSIANNKFTDGYFVIDMTTIIDNDLENAEWNQKLVGHLKSADFFDVENHKQATLRITKATPFKDNLSTIEGVLTIKGITKPITFEAQKEGNTFVAKIDVNRTIYDIKYGSGSFFDNLGDKAISDIFTLEVKLAIKKK